MELLKDIRIELISQRKIFEVRAVPGRIAAAFLHIMAEIRISPAPAAKPFIDSRVLLQKVVRPLLNLGDPFGEDLRLHLKLDKHVEQGSEYRKQQDRDQPRHFKAGVLLFVQNMDREDRTDQSERTVSPGLIFVIQPYIVPEEKRQLQRDKQQEEHGSSEYDS